jgi:hypothetical protein
MREIGTKCHPVLSESGRIDIGQIVGKNIHHLFLSLGSGHKSEFSTSHGKILLPSKKQISCHNKYLNNSRYFFGRSVINRHSLPSDREKNSLRVICTENKKFYLEGSAVESSKTPVCQKNDSRVREGSQIALSSVRGTLGRSEQGEFRKRETGQIDLIPAGGGGVREADRRGRGRTIFGHRTRFRSNRRSGQAPVPEGPSSRRTQAWGPRERNRS